MHILCSTRHSTEQSVITAGNSLGGGRGMALGYIPDLFHFRVYNKRATFGGGGTTIREMVLSAVM